MSTLGTRNPMLALVEGEGDAVTCGALEAAVARIRAAGKRSAGKVVALPSLCNGLWLGWSGDGYDGAAASKLIGEIPTVEHGYPEGHDQVGPQPAIALGGIVQLVVGDNIAWGEVVYKEGAHAALDAPWAPRWLSGAPSLPPGTDAPPIGYVAEGPAVQRERLVLDLGCLGTEFVPNEAKLQRLREKCFRVDDFGHLVIDAAYPKGAEEEDDVAFWARFVCQQYPAALEAAGLPCDPEVLGGAAARLADALGEDERVRSFGPYYLCEEAYQRIVGEADQELGVFPRLALSLARPPRGDRVSWASMSERLTSVAPHDALVQSAWADFVVAGTLYVLDLLADEAPTGDWNGVHLRLDDPWQGGGLWRAEELGEVGPVAADPAIALGLGWVEHTGGEVHRVEGPSPEEPVAAPEWVGEEEEWDVSGSDATWMLHVTAFDIDTARLRVPGKFGPFLALTLEEAHQDRLAVRFLHDGEAETTGWAPLGTDGHLDYEWPSWLRVGTTVWVTWAIGSRVLRIATKLLAEPWQHGETIYTHEFNMALAMAALGLGQGAAKPLTLRQLIRAAVRHKGAVSEDGRRCLTVEEIVTLCFGPDGQVAPGYHAGVLRHAVVRAVWHMARGGDVEFDGETVFIEDSVTRGRARNVDQELLNQYLNSVTQRVRRQVSRSWVQPGIMNLPPDRSASWGKLITWGVVAGTDGLPDGDLGPHQTWRRGYVRGGQLAPRVEAELERARQAMVKATGDETAGDVVDAIAEDPFADEPTANEPTAEDEVTAPGSDAGPGPEGGRPDA